MAKQETGPERRARLSANVDGPIRHTPLARTEQAKETLREQDKEHGRKPAPEAPQGPAPGVPPEHAQPEGEQAEGEKE